MISIIFIALGLFLNRLLQMVSFIFACIIWVILFIISPKKTAKNLINAGCNILCDRDEMSYKEMEDIQRIMNKRDFIKNQEQ